MAVPRYLFDEALETLDLSQDEMTSPDRKSVRQAYSRLAKIHRPDTDPQGFQRLREAYECALEGLDQGVLGHDEGEDDYDSDTFTDDHSDHTDGEAARAVSRSDAANSGSPLPQADRTPEPAAAPEPLPSPELKSFQLPPLVVPPPASGHAGPAAPVLPPAELQPAAPDANPWVESLKKEKADLDALREQVFQALTTEPQSVQDLALRTRTLLSLPALDQIQNRIEVLDWLGTLAAWHPAAKPAWRALVAEARGLDAGSPELINNDLDARLIARLKEDEQLDDFLLRASRDASSPEHACLMDTSWWRMAWLAIDPSRREATNEAAQWLGDRSPDLLNTRSEHQWARLQSFAAPGLVRTLLLFAALWMPLHIALEPHFPILPALLMSAASAFGLTLLALLAFGAGLGWLRDKVCRPFNIFWAVTELALGALILVTAGFTSMSANSGMEGIFWALLAATFPVWILNGNIGFAVRASPLEWVGWLQFIALFSIAVFIAAGGVEYDWPTFLGGFVLLLLCTPTGPVRRFEFGTWGLSGGSIFTLPAGKLLATLAGLHLLHAALCAVLPADEQWTQLALVASGLLLVYADVAFLGLPALASDKGAKFLLFSLFLLPGLTMMIQKASPGMEKVFLDGLMLLQLGLTWIAERGKVSGD